MSNGLVTCHLCRMSVKICTDTLIRNSQHTLFALFDRNPSNPSIYALCFYRGIGVAIVLRLLGLSILVSIFFFRGTPRTLTCSRTEPLVFLGTKTLTTYCNNCFCGDVPCGGSYEVLYSVTDKLGSQEAVKRRHRAEGPCYNFKRWLSS